MADRPKLTAVHTRLFTADVRTIKARAKANGMPWAIELRQLVRRALRGEVSEVVVINEKKSPKE